MNLDKYQTKNPVVIKLINNFLENILSSVKSIEAENILDVGCGEGFVINYLSDNGVSSKIWGTDINLSSLNYLKSSTMRKTDCSLMDIYKLAISDKSVDLVLALEVLEHLDEPDKALCEIKRITKKNCIFSVPYEPFFRIGNFLRGKNLSQLGNDPEHIQNWNKKEFVNLIGKFFNINEVKVSFPWIIVCCHK